MGDDPSLKPKMVLSKCWRTNSERLVGDGVTTEGPECGAGVTGVGVAIFVGINPVGNRGGSGKYQPSRGGRKLNPGVSMASLRDLSPLAVLGPLAPSKEVLFIGPSAG